MTSKHKMAKNTRAQGGYRLAQDKVMTANSLGRLQASTRRSFGGVPLIVLQPWGVGGVYIDKDVHNIICVVESIEASI